MTVLQQERAQEGEGGEEGVVVAEEDEGVGVNVGGSLATTTIEVTRARDRRALSALLFRR